jgi:hypothetical protein
MKQNQIVVQVRNILAAAEKVVQVRLTQIYDFASICLNRCLAWRVLICVLEVRVVPNSTVPLRQCTITSWFIYKQKHKIKTVHTPLKYTITLTTIKCRKHTQIDPCVPARTLFNIFCLGCCTYIYMYMNLMLTVHTPLNKLLPESYKTEVI